MTGKKTKKTRTSIQLDCPCGAKAAVFENGQCRWFSHCISCGRLTFWTNPQLTERARLGTKLCLHNPDLKLCKDGKSKTSWCLACRVRVFVPAI